MKTIDYEYIIIGVIFLVIAFLIFILEIELYEPNKDEKGGFKNYSIKGAILLIIVGCYMIYDEIIKIL